MFYEARPDRLRLNVESLFPADATPEPAFGAIVPHAGYAYSGPVAGAVYARLRIPKNVVILCPNHTGRGTPASIEPSEAWRTPLGDVPVSRRLSERMRELSKSLLPDTRAHAREHSLEVQLPFLQARREDVEIVPICLGEPDLGLCREVGLACAQLAAGEKEPLLLLASTDMNHYESRRIGRAKDERALACIEAIDPEGLFSTVRMHQISMCGFLPVTALLFAAREAGGKKAQVVARRDSGDETDDTDSVVGYAGVVIR